MNYFRALERLESLRLLRFEDLHGNSGQEIEEDPEESTIEEDEQMDEDPEEIARREAKELRASRARKEAKEIRARRAWMAQRFGEIPGVPVGTTWRTRQECYDAGIHRQSLAGIQGTKAKGAFSIVISCYYEDDEDFGDKIIYTGAGGRSSKPGWPTPRGLQVCDQEWADQGNAALLKSSVTGKPVRVVRSSKFVSAFSPVNGYRYDGLYTVTQARREMNKDGLYICRYDMERIPGQPPLPRRRSRGISCIEPRSSPVSVATSDTVFSPSWTPISRKLDDYSEDDPPIYANARPYKDRGFHRVSYLPPPSSSPAAQSSAPAPVTFQGPPSTGMSLVRDVDMSHHSDEDEEQEQGDSDSNLGSGEKEKEDADLDDSPGPYVSSTSSFGASQSQL